jgi:non-heme Fe2+,alpha-ketoglutarate-dependent halogenase
VTVEDEAPDRARPTSEATEARARFQRDGWVGPVAIATDVDLRRMRAEVLARVADPTEDSVACPHLLSAEVDRLMRDPVLTRLAALLLGTERLVVWSSTLFRKEPGAVPFYWHQDAPSWHVEPMSVVSAWVALERADAGNGCVRIVPGSQHRVYHRERKPGGVSSKTIVDEALDLGRARPMTLEAGQAFLFSPYLAHCSGDNPSGRSRWAVAVRYATPEVRVDFARFSIYANRPELWKLVEVPIGSSDA